MASSRFSDADARYMAEAISLAKRGLYTTDPNPRVGCVLVRGGELVGRGWHKKAGTGHAEVNALAEAGDKARGATAYVTLEPCSHYGRTPPCSQALIDAGVTRVVAAMQDPNPEVSGAGFEMLKSAGIDVSWGLLEAQARALNPGFIQRMETGLPWLRIKMATSVDGRTAMASGESQWITGPAARSDVQRLRARSSAIITGIGTILHDDAALTVRAGELGLEPEYAKAVADHQPIRVVMDRRARMPESAKLLESRSSILWCISTDAELNAAGQNIAQLPHVDVLRLGCSALEGSSTPGNSSTSGNSSELQQVLAHLTSLQCNEVLVEAGADLVGSVICESLWNELLVYMAPKLLGSDARPLATLPLASMSESVDMKLQDLRMVGDDIRMTYIPGIS